MNFKESGQKAVEWVKKNPIIMLAIFGGIVAVVFAGGRRRVSAQPDAAAPAGLEAHRAGLAGLGGRVTGQGAPHPFDETTVPDPVLFTPAPQTADPVQRQIFIFEAAAPVTAAVTPAAITPAAITPAAVTPAAITPAAIAPATTWQEFTIPQHREIALQAEAAAVAAGILPTAANLALQQAQAAWGAATTPAARAAAEAAGQAARAAGATDIAAQEIWHDRSMAYRQIWVDEHIRGWEEAFTAAQAHQVAGIGSE